MFNKDDPNVEIQAIKKAIRENKDLRIHKRYMVIVNYIKGYQNCELAEMEFLCGHTIGTYITNYNKYGLDRLILGHSTSTLRLLEQEKTLVETMQTILLMNLDLYLEEIGLLN